MGHQISDELPEVIILESVEETKNLEDGDEYEVDESSFIWKSELRPISAENNVISHKQMYKSCSSVIHAAIDSYAKDKRRQLNKRYAKAVKDLTEEEVKKELKELDVRREELTKALVAFAKMREDGRSKTQTRMAPRKSSLFPARENQDCDDNTDFSYGRQTSHIPRTPLTDITNGNARTLQIFHSQLNDDGFL
uniref:Uncharacterized protein n=1 Tax=Panagrolaimus superbus TaxID=310955 RepID=A0A914YHW1_9BILA